MRFYVPISRLGVRRRDEPDCPESWAFRQTAFETLTLTGAARCLAALVGRGSTFVLWEDINETIKPYLSRHSFALRFRTAQDAISVSVTCYLTHRSGHAEDTTVRLPLDLSDGKSGVHAVGSSAS